MAERLEPRPLGDLDDLELEAALRALGGALATPAAGDGFASRVVARIQTTKPARQRGLAVVPPLRRSVVLAIAATLVLALVAAAAIGYYLPGLRIIFGPTPSLPAPTASAAAGASGPPGWQHGLGQRMSPAEAQARVDFPLLRPATPDPGPPDATYVRSGRVAFVWAPRPGLPATGDPNIGLLLNEFHGTFDRTIVEKIASVGTHVEPVSVAGAPGYWIAGAPHFFMYLDPSGHEIDDSYRSVGQTLVWTRDGITYRLETSLDRDAAIALAESLR